MFKIFGAQNRTISPINTSLPPGLSGWENAAVVHFEKVRGTKLLILVPHIRAPT